MKINFLAKPPAGQRNLVCILGEGAAFGPLATALDKASDGRLTAAMKAAKFTGKRDQIADILAPAKNYDRAILVGAGDLAKLGLKEAELTGGLIAGHLMGAKLSDAVVEISLAGKSAVDLAQATAAVASGAVLRNYHFHTYKSKKPENTVALESLSFCGGDPAKAKAQFVPLSAVAEGVHLARDLVNEPANILYPAEFAKRAKALTKAGVNVEILSPAQMKKLGMGALLGVAQGSEFEPRIVVMRWDGGPQGEAPVAFIGKGVTFDTGGVSIKPAAGMEDMKGDMGGAACVTGLMLALAKRKAKCNVIGAIGLVENAIDGKAQRPGDVVKSMSGQTIAVLNTDAEGRLILADVLWYVQDRFKPKFMVNLATLTGAIMVALGKDFAGLFSNDDKLSHNLLESGTETGEKLWRMPLTPEHDKLIDSDIADMKNIGGRFGGSITAAQFLQRFVNKVPWAHLDIAGTAIDSPKTAINQSWASGWGVRLLNRLVASHYESK